MIHIANKTYEVVVDHKNGWKPDAFRDRYSEVLERYDFIVGDWGYNQLRLRGFFKDTHPKATKETSIATLQDYLNEYCNFGCAYFIIEKIPNKQANSSQDAGEHADQELAEKPENEQAEGESKEPSSEREPQRESSPSPTRHQQKEPSQQNQHQQPRRNHQNSQNKENNQNHNHPRPPRNQHYKQAQQQKQAQQNQQHVKQ